MRGRVAAACAAVLVGLAPAGALPLASFAAAAAVRADSAAQRVETFCVRTAAQPPVKSARIERTAARSQTVRAPSIFRSPAGPAPSQAPPAA